MLFDDKYVNKIDKQWLISAENKDGKGNSVISLFIHLYIYFI